jgi:hypothetical protein
VYDTYRAGRILETAPAVEAKQYQRHARAEAMLAAALGEQDEVTIPGYLVCRTAEGITVKPLPHTLPEGWAQLQIEETA